MAAVNWTNELSIGIAQTDEEHRKLVEILNELDEAMRHGKGTRIMGDILTHLIEYTVVHFRSEEALMEESGYPERGLHGKQHRQLVQKVQRFENDYRNNGRRITKEMMEFLTYWLSNHILVDDMAFGRYYAQCPAPSAQPQEEPVA